MWTILVFGLGLIVGGWVESHNDDLYLNLLIIWCIVGLALVIGDLGLYFIKRRWKNNDTSH
jgi:membrane protein DedA with SNARE-associated domain